MEKTITVQELAGLLEQLLSKRPSRTGQRLCSERDLSARLKVDRMKIQKTFDFLVEKGILVRRHGSGTYVRKIPKGLKKSDRIKWGGDILKTEDLFAKPSTAPVRRQLRQEHRTLRLALLPTWDSESNHSILDGIKDRVRREGHQIKTFTLDQVLPEDVPPHTIPPDPKLVAKLQADPFDGYILWARYVPVMQMAFPDQNPPCVYLGSGARENDLNCAPLVRVDLEDAMVRGLRLLAREGFQRIGLIRFASMSRELEADQKLYDETLSQLGLEYRHIESCRLNEKEALATMRRMFSSKNKPQAVFVDDDILLRHIVTAWKALDIVPGENLAVITVANRGNSLPVDWDWSRLEFHPVQVGRMAVDCLLREIQTAGEELCSFEHLSVWRPGSTHRLRRPDNPPNSPPN